VQNEVDHAQRLVQIEYSTN